MWLMIVMYPAIAFSTLLDSKADCDAVWQMNVQYWRAVGLMPVAGCFPTKDA